MRRRDLLLMSVLGLGAGRALANEGQDLMMKLSPEKQRYALAYFAESAGERCPTGTRAFYQGLARGRAFWNVTCSTGKSYVVTLYPDGSTKVLNCAALKALSGAECFRKFR